MKDIVSELDFENRDDIIDIFESLSKRTRYGLASITEVILYEIGFNDRELVKEISKVIGCEHSEVKIKVIDRIKFNRVDIVKVLKSYPSLRAEDLVSAWAYYRAHRDEIEQQIRENEDFHA